MRTMFALSLTPLFASVAGAQFSVPLPKPQDQVSVRLENLRLGFIAERGDDGNYLRKTQDIRTDVQGSPSAAFVARTKAFCARWKATELECSAALDADSLRAFLRDDASGVRPLRKVYFRSAIPMFGYNRGELGAYMQQSGASESLAFASQFAANVSENEAYVLSNIVRGLAGRVIVSADYALVVVRSDTNNAAKRDTVEGDRANLLRAVNNGGTLVARFTAPMFASSGANFSNAAGITLSGGFIGPLAQADAMLRHAAVSGVGEWLGSLAIRSLTGDATPTAELIIGSRVGYTLSDAPLRLKGGPKDIAYGQAVIGLRQNGSMSVSALITVSNNKFNDLLPRVVLNFSAIR